VRAPAKACRPCRAPPRPTARLPAMSPFWIWMQVAIVAAVLVGIVIAIVKLV
jgi:hypothetical protein